MTADGGGGLRQAEERAQRLDREAAAVSEDASCVGPWRVDRLRAEAGADVTDAEAREALNRWGVRVAELPRLPAGPPAAIARHPGYADAVARLGRKLSIEVVFGSGMKDGFSVLGGLRLDDGRRLDQEAVEAALERTPPAAHREDWERVLSALADAARELGTLDDIIVWEVVEVLRPLTRLGYSQRAVTEQAVRLSLKRAEAEVLAAAVAEEHQMLRSPGPAAEPRREPDSTVPDHAARPDPDDQPDPRPASAPAEELLQPVTDLQVRSIRGRTDVVQLSWTRPSGDGTVRLRCAGERASWPPGTTVTHGDLDAYGRTLPADGLPGPGQRMSCEVALPLARTFVTAVTVGAARAVIGQAVELTSDAPVRGLSQRRFGPEVRLTWIWPDEAAYAYVAWQPSAAAAGPSGAPEARQQRSCSRRAFDAEGGFSAKMGYAAQRVEVWAVISANGEEHYTAPAEIEVPAAGTPVYYDFLPVPGVVNGIRGLAGRPRQLQLRLLAELPCVLPDLIVVRCRHPTQPLAPHHEGEIVQRIPGGPIDPGTPVRQVIPLEGGKPGWMACFADPAKTVAASAQVTLVPPPVGRQKW
jgi:hypothetical protein